MYFYGATEQTNFFPMENQIKEIGQRLYGLREALNLSAAELAAACQLSEKEYLEYEQGNADIPISVLFNISNYCHVEMTALLFGEDPTVSKYFLTRAGCGPTVERTKAYKYQSLAAGFSRRKADPFIVTVEPKPDNTPFYLNTHLGQEFNYVLEGALLLSIDGKELTLHEGDSIYFNASLPHGMIALNHKPVRFLAVIL
jgi:transcriptional regulator with XRE-family HTH domain